MATDINKAKTAIMLFMKTPAKIDTYLKSKMGPNEYLKTANGMVKKLILDKRMSEELVKPVFGIGSNNVKFIEDHRMSATERKKLRATRGSYAKTPVNELAYSEAQITDILCWFQSIMALYGFEKDYNALLNSQLQDEALVTSAIKTYDAKLYLIHTEETVETELAAEELEPIDDSVELVEAESEEEVFYVPTETMQEYRRLLTKSEFLLEYEDLICNLAENIPRIKMTDINIILGISRAGLDIRIFLANCSERMKAIYNEHFSRGGNMHSPDDLKKCLHHKWSKVGERYIVPENIRKIVKDHDKIMQQKLHDIMNIPTDYINFPTKTMVMLLRNSSTATQFLLNYRAPIVKLQYSLNNTELAKIFGVTAATMSFFKKKYCDYDRQKYLKERQEDTRFLIKLSDEGKLMVDRSIADPIIKWECEEINKKTSIISKSVPEIAKLKEQMKADIEKTIENKVEEFKDQLKDTTSEIEEIPFVEEQDSLMQMSFFNKDNSENNVLADDITEKEVENMPYDERPYAPIGAPFTTTPIPAKPSIGNPFTPPTVPVAKPCIVPSLIVPKRYFKTKDGETIVREYYNSLVSPSENDGIKMGFRLGLMISKLDEEEKEKILDFIEAIEEEFPNSMKLSDILKGGE